ncbi:hypothetical protein GE09DRAFT_551489 [Coniochaeta sp. 2T2.1]|nr:hypothetical protein GE09DRAFT_551489 [Coniochaeta sp. 2T2.1]
MLLLHASHGICTLGLFPGVFLEPSPRVPCMPRHMKSNIFRLSVIVHRVFRYFTVPTFPFPPPTGYAKDKRKGMTRYAGRRYANCVWCKPAQERKESTMTNPPSHPKPVIQTVLDIFLRENHYAYP